MRRAWEKRNRNLRRPKSCWMNISAQPPSPSLSWGIPWQPSWGEGRPAMLQSCRNPSWNGCPIGPWDCWILYTMLAAYDALLFCLNKEKKATHVRGPLLTHFFCLPGHIRGTSCHRRDICCLPSSSPLQSLWLKSLRPDLCRFSCYWRKRYWRTEDFSEIIQRSHLSAPCVVFVD